MLILKYLNTFGRYLMLMGRSLARPERMRMFFKQYIKEMSSLGVDSIGIVLLISFFIGAVICIQMKLNIQSPWMPRWVSGYTTREILLLEFSSSIMCLILAGKVGSNIASELGTRLTLWTSWVSTQPTISFCRRYWDWSQSCPSSSSSLLLRAYWEPTARLTSDTSSRPKTLRSDCNTSSTHGLCG